MAADPGASAGIWQDMGLPTAHGFSSSPSWDGPRQGPAYNCQTQCPTVLWRKIWIDTILDCGPWPCTDFFALGWAPTLSQNTFWRTAMLIASKPRQLGKLARALNSTSYTSPALLDPSISKNSVGILWWPKWNMQSPHEKWPWLIRFMELPQRDSIVSIRFDPGPSF